MPAKSDIRNRALRKLRALEPGQTPGADDITDVEQGYDELYSFLVSKKAVTWDSDDDIPDNAAEFVVKMLAYHLSDDYAQPEPKVQRMKIEAYGITGTSDRGALGELIDLAKPDYVEDISEGVYY